MTVALFWRVTKIDERMEGFVECLMRSNKHMGFYYSRPFLWSILFKSSIQTD